MISAIILAAGTSSRMEGKNKLLLPFAGKTPLRFVVENVLAAGPAEVIVVTGHQAEQVREVVGDLPVTFVHNEAFAQGMTTSIQRGVAVAGGDGYMICLSDMPFLSGSDYAQLLSFFEAQQTLDKACIAVPVSGNKQGNPVIFSAAYRNEILSHEAMDGCKELLHTHQHHLKRLIFNSNHIVKDIDNNEDYFLALAEKETLLLTTQP